MQQHESFVQTSPTFQNPPDQLPAEMQHSFVSL